MKQKLLTVWKILTFQKIKKTWFISLMTWAVIAGFIYFFYILFSGQF